ncbi:hypothetical protein HYT24_01905 [Candidatus Pacearchaeota archaeon]|nr:hypothetical protein [Candidatus Pacearchaeota archaeon]
MNFLKDRKGWIRIVEAFVMIVLLTGLVLVILNKGQIGFNDSSESIYLKEQTTLNEIQTNNTLRNYTLNATVPLEWANFPAPLKTKINSSDGLDCSGKVCALGDDCISNISAKSVYTQSVIITANLNTYNPRRLKIFCAEK